jgi:cytochrome P450
VAVEEQGDRLSPEKLLGICQVLLIAGQETTTCLIGNMVQLLPTHPEALGAMRQSPQQLAGAIEEALRY